MARLTRTQQQERTRAAVLAAAREEFAEHGFVNAKIDQIAERAELTRGAVYSNFPSKRALYLAVLIASVEAPDADGVSSVQGLDAALGAFARVWLERLPLSGDTSADGKLRLRSLTGLFDDEPGRAVSAQLTRLEAVLLATRLETCTPGRSGREADGRVRPDVRGQARPEAGGPGWPEARGQGLLDAGGSGRLVRLAELVITLLGGAGQLGEVAPGAGDPFDVARACEHLASLDLGDAWDPPYLGHVKAARAVQEAWRSPGELTDLLSGRPVGFGGDGVVAVLGAARLEAAEEAVRAARPGDQVTVAVVTSDPAETGRLVRLRIGDLAASLRRVFPPDDRLRVVLDDQAAVASSLGVTAAGDTTETAVRVHAGQIVSRASGRGAAHAAATTSQKGRTP